MKKPLVFPDFNDVDAVNDFMDKTDFSEYLEPSDLKPLDIHKLVAQSKLKTKSVAIRLPEKWIVKAKLIAGQMDMPYQTFIKQIIRKGLQIEAK